MGHHKTKYFNLQQQNALNATSQTLPERLTGAAPAAVSGGLVVGREFLKQIAEFTTEAVRQALGVVDDDAEVPEEMAHLPAQLTVGKAAEFLKCSKLEVSALIDTGELRMIDIATPDASRRCLRIPRESLASHYRKTQVQAVPSH